MASGPITSWQIDRETGNNGRLYFGDSKITADGDCSHGIKRRLLLGRKDLTNLDSILKSRYYFANKGPSSQGYGFSSSHVWMWQLDYKESWVLKNWCFWTVVLEKTLESPLDCKEIQPVSSKGSKSWIFIGRTDVEAETPILWSPDGKSWIIWKDPDAGKNWRREEKGMTEDEMVGKHHWLSEHAAAAKSLQSCPTLCDPIGGSPPGSPVPGILQARTLEWVTISFSNAWKWKVEVKLLSRVQLLVTPWTAAYQAPLSMGVSRQEYCSGLPLPSWTQ